MHNYRKVCGDKIHLWLNHLGRGLKCLLKSMKQPFTAGEAVVCRLLSESHNYLWVVKRKSYIARILQFLLPWHHSRWELDKCGGQFVLCGLPHPSISCEQMGFHKTALRKGIRGVLVTWLRWHRAAVAEFRLSNSDICPLVTNPAVIITVLQLMAGRL